METTLDQPVRDDVASRATFAPGVERVLTVFVNAYLVGEPEGAWVLVDTGLPGLGPVVKRAAARRFGEYAFPEAIVLTHGHFDHAGSVVALAEEWDVPVYAHPLELPFLTGRSGYPPQDPTVGGALGLMSRAFPTHGVDLGRRVQPLPEDGSVPGVTGWRWLHTPGHTAGHVSLFREADGVLLAGDALATVNQDSLVATLTQSAALSVPPAPLTTDWGAARQSVELLASLRPRVVAAGHGRPVGGPAVADDLQRFAERFTPPARGRYANVAARTDEEGILFVPPPVADPLPKQLLTVAAVGAALYALTRGKKKR